MLVPEPVVLTRQAWLDWLLQCPSATFFHTPYWYEGWAHRSKYRISAQLLTLHGKEFFFAHARRTSLPGIATVALSSPAGTYGAYLCKSAISRDEYEILQSRFGTAVLNLLVFSPFQAMECLPEGYRDTTRVLSLSGSFEDWLGKWSKGHLSAARQGIREGISVQQGITKDDWHRYFALYEADLLARGRKSSSRYPLSFFEYLSELPESVCRLWLASSGDILAAGAVVFYFNRHATYWHGVGSKPFRHLKAGHVLQYHILQDLSGRPFDWYDMQPDGGHAGVDSFKKGFGCTSLPVVTAAFSGSRWPWIRYGLKRLGYAK